MGQTRHSTTPSKRHYSHYRTWRFVTTTSHNPRPPKHTPKWPFLPQFNIPLPQPSHHTTCIMKEPLLSLEIKSQSISQWPTTSIRLAILSGWPSYVGPGYPCVILKSKVDFSWHHFISTWVSCKWSNEFWGFPWRGSISTTLALSSLSIHNALSMRHLQIKKIASSPCLGEVMFTFLLSCNLKS